MLNLFERQIAVLRTLQVLNSIGSGVLLSTVSGISQISLQYRSVLQYICWPPSQPHSPSSIYLRISIYVSIYISRIMIPQAPLEML